MSLVPLALRRDPLEVLACLASEPGALLLEVPDPERPVTLIGCRPVAGVERELRDRAASDQRDRTFRIGDLEQQRARLAREAGEHLERIPPERERNEGHRAQV